MLKVDILPEYQWLNIRSNTYNTSDLLHDLSANREDIYIKWFKLYKNYIKKV